MGRIFIMSNIPAATKLLLLSGVLEEFGPLATVQMVRTFICIAQYNDITKGMRTKELEKRMGMYSSSTSRNVAALTYRNSPKTGPKSPPVLDLLIKAPDPDDTRANVLYLSPQGKRLWERMKSSIMN